jgi:hypothetical protein
VSICQDASTLLNHLQAVEPTARNIQNQNHHLDPTPPMDGSKTSRASNKSPRNRRQKHTGSSSARGSGLVLSQRDAFVQLRDMHAEYERTKREEQAALVKDFKRTARHLKNVRASERQEEINQFKSHLNDINQLYKNTSNAHRQQGANNILEQRRATKAAREKNAKMKAQMIGNRNRAAHEDRLRMMEWIQRENNIKKKIQHDTNKAMLTAIAPDQNKLSSPRDPYAQPKGFAFIPGITGEDNKTNDTLAKDKLQKAREEEILREEKEAAQRKERQAKDAAKKRKLRAQRVATEKANKEVDY